MTTEAKFLTVKQAAETLGVSPNTVRAWGASGTLPEYRHAFNNYRLFKDSDIEKVRNQIANPVLQSASKRKQSKRRAK